MHLNVRFLLACLLSLQLFSAPLNKAFADDFDDDFDLDFSEEELSPAPTPQKQTAPASEKAEKTEDSPSIFSEITDIFSPKETQTETAPKLAAPVAEQPKTKQITATAKPQKKQTNAPQKTGRISEKAANKRKILPKERPTAQAMAANVDLLTRVRRGLPFTPEELEGWILSTSDINYCYENGQTMLLYLVARYPDTESLRMLIENGADLQTHCTPRYEALFIAAINNPSPQIIDMLTTNGANIVERDTEKNTALILAATFNPSPSVVATLIDYGLRPETVNSYGYNALMLAAYENGRISIIDTLLNNGAKIDATDEEGHTALMAAAIRGRDDVMQHLIRRGADFKAVDKKGISVLDYYNKRHYLKTLDFEISPMASPSEKLMKQFQFIADKHFSYNEAIRQAPFSQNPEQATADAIKNLADIDVVDEYGCTPFLNAARADNPLSVLEQFLNAKANINATCRNGQNALMFLTPYANENRTPEIETGKLKYLLRNNINVNATDDGGNSVLMYALAHHDDPQFIATLIKAGADVNNSSHEGETPLWTALRSNGAPENIKLLIEYGAKVNQRDARRETPLWFQLRTHGNPELTIYLIRGGADVNVKNATGDTPLWYALHHQYDIKLINALIQADEDLNIKDSNGDTPLLFAVKNNYPTETIKLLLENGANPDIADKNGYTMSDVLQSNQFFDETVKKRTRENVLNGWQ